MESVQICFEQDENARITNAFWQDEKRQRRVGQGSRAAKVQEKR